MNVDFIQDKYNNGVYRPIINDVIDEKGGIFNSDYEKMYSMYIYSNEVLNVLFECKTNNIAYFFRSIEYRTSVCGFKASISVQFEREKINRVTININFNLENWARPYTASTMISKLTKSLYTKSIFFIRNKYRSDKDIVVETGLVPYFEVRKNGTMSMKNCIEDSIMDLKTSLSSTIDELTNEFQNNEFVVNFNFPKEIRTACNQYLVYFAQFLADLGIDAQTEIKERMLETLFRVTPTDKETSLESIREALDIYLNLPEIQYSSGGTSNENNIAILQLQSQISNFRSQLQLAQAAILMKDATIQAQSASLEAIRLSAYQIKLVEDKPKKDQESILGDYLSVEAVNFQGIVVNSPEIVRRIKEFWAKLWRR